jgi:small-conductance mechanosensitive channel
VVFQDFILAFCGWFVLMGPNGVRIRDWVEIDGVGGEVVKLGLFRTWLLETKLDCQRPSHGKKSLVF